jgi:exopolyphosphatase / guanosine-5'-triphosphate,3'-diphosphate pyrophosphatase
VGSVSLSMRYFNDGRFTEAAFRAAQVAAGAELEEAMQPFAPRHWREALGSSGTAGAVSQLLAANGVSDGRITPDGLRWCIARCLEAGHIDRLSLAGLKDERRPVIAGGLSLLYTLAMHFGIQELMPARGALRQGVIFDLDERLEAQRRARPGDMRDDTVAELQRRFAVDRAQAARVQRLALSLYHDAMPEAAAGDDATRELAWACDLHEIGMMVSHHDHHRHSAYLLAHADAPGFSQSQQRRVGELVLGQRGGLRKMDAQLTQSGFAWQVLCLRLAIIACHARSDVGSASLHLTRRKDGALLSFAPGWAEAHPRTLHLLREEAEAWGRNSTMSLLIEA